MEDAGSRESRPEDYSNRFIRLGSNIATFQLDRNLLEAHILEVCKENPRFQFLRRRRAPRSGPAEAGPHRVTFSGKKSSPLAGRRLRARAVPQAQAGPGARESDPARLHLVLGGRPGQHREAHRAHPQAGPHAIATASKQGNFPFFLATNHFCGEGRWFWVIPLHGKTSLGLVYDKSVIHRRSLDRAQDARLRLPRVAVVCARSAPAQGARRGPLLRLFLRRACRPSARNAGP